MNYSNGKVSLSQFFIKLLLRNRLDGTTEYYYFRPVSERKKGFCRNPIRKREIGRIKYFLIFFLSFVLL